MNDKNVPVLILVNGAASTGKTTISQTISKKYHIPYYSKDDFRDILINALGSGDSEWVKKCGFASSEIFRLIMERSIGNMTPVIIDTIFFEEILSPFIKKLGKKYKFEIIQVFCTCDPKVAFERYVNRSKSGERNPGFLEELTFEEARRRQNEWRPANIRGSLVEIDTTDFSTVPDQLEKLYKIIEKLDWYKQKH